MFDGPQTSVAMRPSEGPLGRGGETADQPVVRLDEIGRPMVDRFDAALPIDRVHDLLQPARGHGPVEGAGQADIDVTGRMVRHHAEAFAAFDARHRGGGSERKRRVMHFGESSKHRHLQRKGGGLVQRIDAGSLDLARVRRLAGKMQLGAQEAAAADHDAVVAGIAQRHGVGRPRDGVEIGPHAAEAAGMLVGIEQHVHRAARDPRPASCRATWARMATPDLESAAPRPSSRRPRTAPQKGGSLHWATSPAGAVSMQASRQSTGPGAAPAISTRTATSLPSPSLSRRGARRLSASQACTSPSTACGESMPPQDGVATSRDANCTMLSIGAVLKTPTSRGPRTAPSRDSVRRSRG